MSENFIDEKNIKLEVDCNNWEEAIRNAGKLLVENKYVKQDYVEQMVQSINELGPYIVIVPNIALAHARPGESVLKEGVSMITLSKPVEFGNKANDPVSIIFAFATKTNDSHLSSLSKLVNVLSNEETIIKLKKSNDVNYVQKLVNGKEV